MIEELSMLKSIHNWLLVVITFAMGRISSRV